MEEFDPSKNYAGPGALTFPTDADANYAAYLHDIEYGKMGPKAYYTYNYADDDFLHRLEATKSRYKGALRQETLPDVFSRPRRDMARVTSLDHQWDRGRCHLLSPQRNDPRDPELRSPPLLRQPKLTVTSQLKSAVRAVINSKENGSVWTP